MRHSELVQFIMVLLKNIDLDPLQKECAIVLQILIKEELTSYYRTVVCKNYDSLLCIHACL